MATSIRTFNIELYQEHLEEASFLYEQRRSLLHDPEVSWCNISDFEERLEAHIDALVVGDDLALDVCRKRAKGGDFGELFAAVCVFCRQKRANLLSEVLQSLDYSDNEKGIAVADALKYELPAEWSVYIEQALKRRNARLTPILATVCGYRRLPMGGLMQDTLAVNLVGAQSSPVWALGRLKAHDAQAALEACLQHADTSIRSAALLAILRIGKKGSLQPYYAGAKYETWACVALGLGGGRSAGNVLLEIAKSGKANSDCLLALGLLGDPAALQTLYDCLKQPELADSAALALNCITGAKLIEEVFVPEEVKEEDLFESELTAWRERKEPPKRADGKPFGEKVKKLSTNKDTWKRWFTDNASKIDRNLRYRNGKLCTPASLLENLADDRSDHRLRKFVAEEVVIRYGCDVPFEIDMPVAQQVKAIREIKSWVDGNGARFQPGRWYFAGRLVD